MKVSIFYKHILANREEMIDLDYHHVVTTTEFMGMGTDHQQLLSSQKDGLDIKCLLDERIYYHLTSTSNL